MPTSRLTLFLLGFALSLLTLPAAAQLAPTPNKAPRTPVKSSTLPNGRQQILPPSHVLSGKATVLDNEKIRLNDFDLRLFGIVPPQMSAPLGPQARAVLDALTEGQTSCEIKDREKTGLYHATCKNESGADFGIEMLRRGLAVAARGSLQPTALAVPYLASEQAAQTQRLGLWATKIPPAASSESIGKAAAEAQAAKKEVERLLAEKKEAEKQAELLKSESAATEGGTGKEPEPVLLKAAESWDTPLPRAKPAKDSPEEPAAVPKPETKPDSIVSLGPTSAEIQNYLIPPAPKMDEILAAQEQVFARTDGDWLEKHQIFATGLVLLAASLAFVGSHFFWRRREEKGGLKALAAAIRGELMAARSIAKSRLARWSGDNLDERSASWPRIRIIVFQAHVARLGELGAELARQIASIYGQASDYASYYGSADATGEIAAKKQSLQTLLDHIEEVLPRLEAIEAKGFLPPPPSPAKVTPSLFRRLCEKKKLGPPPDNDGGTPAVLSSPQAAQEAKAPSKQDTTAMLASLKAEIMKDDQRPAVAAKKKPPEKARNKKKRVKETLRAAVDPLKEKLQQTLERGRQRLAELRYRPDTETLMPEYANLTEEELEALAESYFNEDPMPPSRRRAG